MKVEKGGKEGGNERNMREYAEKGGKGEGIGGGDVGNEEGRVRVR